jgi:hypothetical protein
MDRPGIVRALKRRLRRVPGFYPVTDWLLRRRDEQAGREWAHTGRPVPPPHAIKQQNLRDHGRRYGLRILVETGTARGDMIQAMIDSFDRIISIELSDELFANAQWRFRRAGKVELLHGDSGAMLGEVVPNLAGPALFWLDGHYSAGMTALGEKSTPIYDELEHVLRSPERGHVIVIDDARLFGTDPDYPTFAELEAFVRARRDDLEVALGDDDSIRVTPRA